MWETFPLSRKRFLPVTQPWPGNPHWAAHDCLCPLRPARPPGRGSAQLGSALAEGARVPPETWPPEPGRRAGHVALGPKNQVSPSREKPEPNKFLRLLLLLRGPRVSPGRSCLFRVVLHAHSRPRQKPRLGTSMPGSSFTVTAACVQLGGRGPRSWGGPASWAPGPPRPGSTSAASVRRSMRVVPSPWRSPCWMGGGGQRTGWRRGGWASGWAGCVRSG